MQYIFHALPLEDGSNYFQFFIPVTVLQRTNFIPSLNPSPTLSNFTLANWLKTLLNANFVAYAWSIKFIIILYADIVIPYRAQAQYPSKKWVFENHLSFKVRLSLQYKPSFSTTVLVHTTNLSCLPAIPSFVLAIFSPLYFAFIRVHKPSPQPLPTLPRSKHQSISYRHPNGPYQKSVPIPQPFNQFRLHQEHTEQGSPVRTGTVLISPWFSEAWTEMQRSVCGR